MSHSPKKLGACLGLALALAGCVRKSVYNAAVQALETPGPTPAVTPTPTPTPEPTYSRLPGQPAQNYLAPLVDAAPIGTNADLMQAIELAIDDAALLKKNYVSAVVQTARAGTVTLLKIGVRDQRIGRVESFQPGDLEPDDAAGSASLQSLSSTSVFDPKLDTVPDSNWTYHGPEYLIPRVLNIPTKNQGGRPTCSSFAAMGDLEYLALKKHSRLTSLDLSEQRFYAMSRPDDWLSGGTVGGSYALMGFAVSFGLFGYTMPIDLAPEFPYPAVFPYAPSIPLEVDCPYNPYADPNGNRLQLPHRQTCRRGAIRVTSLTTSTKDGLLPGYTGERFAGPLTAQQVINRLKNSGLPVLVGTRLSGNWEVNNGIVTWADTTAAGQTNTHAYLIVGWRKLDPEQFPDEGGMCFIIKNSWDLGWGIDGYSCMTLAWFNQHRKRFSFMEVYDIDVDVDYILQRRAQELATIASLPSLAAEPTPVSQLTLSPVPTNPGPARKATPDPSPRWWPPQAIPATAATTEDGFTIGGLVGLNGTVYKVIYRIQDDVFGMKGIVAGNEDPTIGVWLSYDPATKRLTYQHSYKGAVTVGDVGVVKPGIIRLCSGPYAFVCELNYRQAYHKLVLGLTEMEFERRDGDPDGGYVSPPVANYPGYALESAEVPESAALRDFRLRLKQDDGTSTLTKPIRLKVDPATQKVWYLGFEVGDWAQGVRQLCSGPYRPICRFVVTEEDQSLDLFVRGTVIHAARHAAAP